MRYLVLVTFLCLACDDGGGDPTPPTPDMSPDMRIPSDGGEPEPQPDGQPEPEPGPEADATLPDDQGRPPVDGGPMDRGVDPDDGVPDMRPPAVARVVINEAVPSPLAEAEDWFELTAIGPAGAQVSLAGMTIIDSDPENIRMELPDRMLTVGEFLVIDAVGANGPSGPLNAHFKLGGGDALTLSNAAGEVVDSVTWVDGDANDGQSWGRLPDGTGDWGTRRPTRGQPNADLDPSQPLTPFPREVVTVRLTVADADWMRVRTDPAAGEWVAADLDFGGLMLPQIAIRTYGGASLDAAVEAGTGRFPLRLDLNRLVDGQDLFGKNRFELDNGYADPSRMKVALAFQLFREFGVPAPQTAFVDLWINGQHIGLYTLIESIDADFVRQFEDNDGDLYRPELPASALTDLGAAYAPYANSANIERNADTTDHSDFLRLIAAINRGTPLAEAIDVDVALRYLAANVALVNLDSYIGEGENYWLYADGGIFKIIPWDVNRAFGGESCGCRPADLIGLPIEEPTCGPMRDRPLIGRLLGDPMRLAEYHTLIERFIDVPAHPEVLGATITALANRIRPYVEGDPTGFDDAIAFEQAVGANGDLLGFMQARAMAIRAQLAGEAPASGDGGGCREPVP